MENETPDKPGSKKVIYIICLSLIIVFIICYSIMIMLGPGRKLAAIKSEYGFVQDKKSKTDERIISDSAYLALLKERSFLQSRIAMAATDSIYLAISFPDSIINLEISGVTVHTTKILKSNSSRILKRNEFEILSMLARPFTITSNYASIKKEPLMIKMAPKDTSEFQPDIIPDTADYEPVNFILQTDKGTRIIVYQEEKIRYGDGIRLFMFDLWFRIKDTLRSIKSVMLFRIPEYYPSFRLRIHRSDAKIIYRALPEHGQIGVYM